MFTFGLLCFTSFFTLINPLGAMPVFMTMTMELDEKERRKVARRASLVSFLIMMFFAISGDLLFRFFGISIDSLRIVGCTRRRSKTAGNMEGMDQECIVKAGREKKALRKEATPE